MFRDRAEAGRRLAEKLSHLKWDRPVVLALPRGGVPVGAEVARALAAPLDVIIVRKIGVPSEPELAMGAIVDGDDPVIVRNADVIASCGVSAHAFDHAAALQCAEIARRKALYGRAGGQDVGGRDVIVVDDGLATGATAKAAIAALRKRNPARIVLAVPVAPVDTLDDMRALVDEVVCIEAPGWFTGVGGYYRHFDQVADEEVLAILEQFRSAEAQQSSERTNRNEGGMGDGAKA